MTIDEMIERLAAIRDEWTGKLPVYRDDSEWGEQKVNAVEVNSAGAVFVDIT